ncbi:MAG: cardiolipin synthase [Faecalimonas sp.]|nr:cardiolipin synthase [Faecalimonas sp.]
MDYSKIKESQPVKKAKKGIFHILFSRMAVVAVLLLLQIGILVASLTRLNAYMAYINAAMVLLEIVSVIYIINSKSNPAFKITWILLIFVMPFFGTLFYVFIKITPGAGLIERRLRVLEGQTSQYMQQDASVLESLRLSKPANANLAHYMNQQMSYPVHRNTSVTYFSSGEEKFAEMKKQLAKAERFIFLEYFIIEEGEMWNALLDILAEKVNAGVEVRFLYDGTCSMMRVPFQYDKKLRKLGIQTKIFSPIRPIISSYQNNRDHRKICVIDGIVGFTGGVNLADEYINAKEIFGHWKDTAVMLEGEAVQNLTILFLQMWNVTQRKAENFEKYLTPKSDEVKRELGFVLPYGDSPYDNENTGEQVYLHILNHAKKYVHIMTPYLVLDNELVTALTFAAKCGIEVIIIMPHIPDKWYAFVLAKTHYRTLIEAGVQIYEYTPGFVHAKVFVSDNDTATVGTINLDYRSLYHHFECGAFIYNNPVVWEIERDFQKTLADCQQVTLEQLKSRSILEKLVGSILKLIAPLM